MKKLFAVLLTLAMIFSLTACGESGTLEGDEAESFVNDLTQSESEIIDNLNEQESDFIAESGAEEISETAAE